MYLEDEHVERLDRLARVEGTSQSEVIRRAISSYVPRPRRDRDFSLAGIGEGPGGSIADVPDEELLEGFAE